MDHKPTCKTKKALKILEDIIEENLDDLGFSNDFLDKTLKACPMKEGFDKWAFIKMKHFYSEGCCQENGKKSVGKNICKRHI